MNTQVSIGNETIWIVTRNFDSAEMREKKNNQFEWNCGEQRSPLYDSDPDVHYHDISCNNLVLCGYYSENNDWR